MNVNFFCTYWGSKYDKKYVQNLHDAVKRNYQGEFNFYCQTDQKLNIDGVVELPFGKYKPVMEDGRFPDKPKCNFWEPNAWGISGRKVFFDLDIVILGNLNTLIDGYNGKPIINKSWWKEEQGIEYDYLSYHALTNGSVYIWEDSEYTEEIWKHINKYDKYIFFCCVSGTDNYLTTFHLDKFDFVPKDMVFSYHNQVPKNPHRYIICTVETINDEQELHQMNDVWIRSKWNG